MRRLISALFVLACLGLALGLESCSSGWYITGYYIPHEKDFKGPKVSLNVKGTTYKFKQDFIKAVKLEGDGETEYGWYLHCCWSKETKIIGACGTELKPMQSVARDPALMRCGRTLQINTEELKGRTFSAQDTGGAIKGKHLDVFCGFGNAAKQIANKITTKNAEVCLN